MPGAQEAETVQHQPSANLQLTSSIGLEMQYQSQMGITIHYQIP
jgi:hypothetical protein